MGLGVPTSECRPSRSRVCLPAVERPSPIESYAHSSQKKTTRELDCSPIAQQCTCRKNVVQWSKENSRIHLALASTTSARTPTDSSLQLSAPRLATQSR